MSNSKLKKPGKVGSKKSFWGVIMLTAVVLLTFMASFGLNGGLPLLLKKILAFGQMNPVFAILIVVGILIGGTSLGSLMKGGTSVGDTTAFSDLDKL